MDGCRLLRLADTITQADGLSAALLREEYVQDVAYCTHDALYRPNLVSISFI